MAHNLHIEQKFEDFAAFESAIMRYQNAENVQFYMILALAIYIFPRRKISLSLLIKMAHNLHIEQKFEDFAAFESAIMRYQNAENVQFYSRVSRSDDKAQQRLNPKIKYYEVKYHGINGVKKRISKATGAREGRYVVQSRLQQI